jgi:hypothetical protein
MLLRNPGEPLVLVDTQGRVVRSPETEAEISGLKARIAELEGVKVGGSGDHKIEASIFKILDLVTLLRDEEGLLGTYTRQVLADMLETPPTAEDVRVYLDHHKESGGMTIDEALSRANDQEEKEEIWFSVRNDEKPIAEFCALWHDDGERRSFKELRDYGPRWHITPEEYR